MDFLTNFVSTYHIQFQIMAHVALAMTLGAIIGIEREVVDKPAGLRTHMLVAGAAALLTELSTLAIQRFDTGLGGQLVQSDPIRVIEAVITGVSFLGAGTIVVRSTKTRVIGLTTAASILFIAAVGICVALSQEVLAVALALLVLITLRGLGFVHKRLGGSE